MIPKSLSASSVQTFELCPARWWAEYFVRAPQPSNPAGDLGSACHQALELYVARECYKKHDDNYDTLISLFTDAYDELFEDNSMFDDGEQMLRRWHERQNWTDRVVLSTEKKDNFILKTPSGIDLTFNYIWDRCDLLEGPHQAKGETIIEVIDYKTWRRYTGAGGLADKIQVRCYALAAQIAFPQATKIWVTLDQLRYDEVGTVFTREQNIATWKYLRRTAERIFETLPFDAPHVEAPASLGAVEKTYIPDPKAAKERLNTECRFCIRKNDCSALKANVDVGGIMHITDPLEAGHKRHALLAQRQAIEAAMGELDTIILEFCENEDVLDLEDGELEINITASKRREVDAAVAGPIVGPDLLLRYGKLNVGSVDAILADPAIDDELKAALRGTIRLKFGEPSVQTKLKNPIDS